MQAWKCKIFPCGTPKSAIIYSQIHQSAVKVLMLFCIPGQDYRDLISLIKFSLLIKPELNVEWFEMKSLSFIVCWFIWRMGTITTTGEFCISLPEMMDAFGVEKDNQQDFD